MNRFRDLVESYLKFVLKDIKGKIIQVSVEPHYRWVAVQVKFYVKDELRGIRYCVDYTEDINVFDSELMSIANQIKEVIEYERNGKIL